MEWDAMECEFAVVFQAERGRREGRDGGLVYRFLSKEFLWKREGHGVG